jgi:hypothetical protein
MLELRQNWDDGHAAETLPFDRRRGSRESASGSMQAVLANGRDMPWVLRLGLVNASNGGLCVTTDAPLDPGARLSMRIDPVHGNWITGSVVRCEPVGDRYRLGIAYESCKRAA